MVVSSSQQQKIRRQHRIQLGAFLSLLCLLFTILLTVNNMLLSTVLAFVIYFMFGPLVNLMERQGLNRTLSISLLFFLSGLLLAFSLTAIYPLISVQVNTLKSELPKYIDGTTDLIKKIEYQLVFLSEIFEDINLIEQTETYLYSFTKSFFEDLPNFLSHSLTTSLLAPFFAFFMLKDGPRISKKFFNMVPNNLFELSLNLKHQINLQLGSFVRARLLEAVLVGSLVWAGLWLIKFPFAPLLAIFAALANLVPYIGPIVGAAPALIIALVNDSTPFNVLMVMTPYFIAQLIDMLFIIPVVVAKIVNLHPVTVIVAFIIGAQLLGILGMVIAIPMASVIKVTIINVYQHLVEFRQT